MVRSRPEFRVPQRATASPGRRVPTVLWIVVIGLFAVCGAVVAPLASATSVTTTTSPSSPSSVDSEAVSSVAGTTTVPSSPDSSSSAATSASSESTPPSTSQSPPPTSASSEPATGGSSEAVSSGPASPSDSSVPTAATTDEVSSAPSTAPSTAQSAPTPPPTVTVAPSTDVVILQPVAPALSNPTPPFTWIIAVLVLVIGALFFVVLRRRIPVQGPTPPPVTAVWDSRAPVPKGSATFAAVEAVGEAMIDAGYSVDSVQAALEDIAAVNGFPSTEVVALPTALFVSTRGGDELLTGAVASGGSKLLLHQVDALDRLVRDARVGILTPVETIQGIVALRTAPPPARRAFRVAAYMLLSAGLAVLLGASWSGVAFSTAFGAIAGTVLLLTEKAPRQFQPLVTVGLAFGVSTATFLIAGAGYDPGILPSLIAPLVTLLPGALLTTGIIELSTGQMMSGAGRLAAGFMQLVLLAVGIVAGSALVGVPEIDLTEAHDPIGLWGPWVAVAAFGVGIVIHQGGRYASIPWILLVLYVAYGAQVVGDIFFGGVLSALIGALAMTPVAILVARQPTGPAAMTSFLPAFWLLVPGALGLVGVTSILGGNGAGTTTLVTTIATMVAIALGILAGSALSGRLRSSRRALL